MAPGGKARRLMSKDTREAEVESTVGWGELEEFVRGKVQELIQAVLEEEVTELLGRSKSERRTGVDAEV